MSNTRKTIALLLLPVSIWYAIGILVRNLLFTFGIKKEEVPHVTTIGVGNLSTGGTGKTPHTEYLLKLLSGTYHTAFLSRGYKRKSKGFVLSTGDPDAKLIGDEPAMVARKFPDVTTAVCEKRMIGIKNLLQSENEPALIILDDVYQHRYVKPSINILLTEYYHPFYQDTILPFGNLREFRSAKNRAQIIIVTKCPEKLDPMTRNNIIHHIKPLPFQQVFFSYFSYETPIPIFPNNGCTPEEATHALVLTGIAHPKYLLKHIKKQYITSSCTFPDHHDFTTADISQVVDTFNNIPTDKKIIITTEKDASRLQASEAASKLKDLPIFIVPVSVKFLDEPNNSFDKTITDLVRENISFLSSLKAATKTILK